MRNNVESTQTLSFADRANRLAHVGDGKLAGLPIDVVAHESAARSAGRPRQHDANEIRPEQSANAPGRKGCISEGVVVAMNEDNDLLATMYAPNAGQGFTMNSHRGKPLPRGKALSVQSSTAVSYSVDCSYGIINDEV